jgi:hypothetical protein
MCQPGGFGTTVVTDIVCVQLRLKPCLQFISNKLIARVQDAAKACSCLCG